MAVLLVASLCFYAAFTPLPHPHLTGGRPHGGPPVREGMARAQSQGTRKRSSKNPCLSSPTWAAAGFVYLELLRQTLLSLLARWESRGAAGARQHETAAGGLVLLRLPGHQLHGGTGTRAEGERGALVRSSHLLYLLFFPRVVSGPIVAHRS
jgi:hypothetical protein